MDTLVSLSVHCRFEYLYTSLLYVVPDRVLFLDLEWKERPYTYIQQHNVGTKTILFSDVVPDIIDMFPRQFDSPVSICTCIFCFDGSIFVFGCKLTSCCITFTLRLDGFAGAHSARHSMKPQTTLLVKICDFNHFVVILNQL